jgi:hypothetical protein
MNVQIEPVEAIKTHISRYRNEYLIGAIGFVLASFIFRRRPMLAQRIVIVIPNKES